MRVVFLVSVLLCCLPLLGSCGADASQSDSLSDVEAATSIVSIQTNDALLRVHTGDRYTLESRDGDVLAHMITLEQLWAISPELAERVERGVAGAIDATLYADDVMPGGSGTAGRHTLP